MARRCVMLVLTCVLIPSFVTAQRIKLPTSRKNLEKIVQQNPDDAVAHYNVALAYWNEKKWQDAETRLQTAVVIEPRLAEAHLALAYLPYAKRSKLWEERFDDDLSDSLALVLEDARREERHAYLIDPLVDRTIIGATTPKMSAAWDSNDFLRALYESWYQGFDDFIARKYEDAFFRYDKLLREWGRSIEVDREKPPVSWVWYRALAAARTGRHEAARAGIDHLLRRSLSEEESDNLIHLPLRTNEYRYMLAVIEHNAGNLQSAVELYEDALEHDLGLYMAHVRIAEIYESQRKYPQAIKERRRAVNANPDDSTLLMDLGIALGKAGQFAEATEYLEQARAANPRHALMPFWLGLAQMQLQEFDQARESFSVFIEMAPARYEQQLTMARQNLAKLE